MESILDFGDSTINYIVYGTLTLVVLFIVKKLFFSESEKPEALRKAEQRIAEEEAKRKSEEVIDPKTGRRLTAKEIAERKSKGKYTAEQVAVHNKKDDCWLIIDGKVYDVTPYVEQHMGGDAILRNAGGDSSKGFHGEQHAPKVQDLLWEFHIGDLVSN